MYYSKFSKWHKLNYFHHLLERIYRNGRILIKCSSVHNVHFENWIRRMLINILRFWSRTKYEVVKNKIKFTEFLEKKCTKASSADGGKFNILFKHEIFSYSLISKEAMWKLVPFSKSFCFMKLSRFCTCSPKTFLLNLQSLLHKLGI